MLRRQSQPPPPQPPELTRLDAARERLAQGPGGSVSTDAVLADVRRSVAEALTDRLRLQQVLAGLDPERAAAELKAALRARARPDEPDNEHVAALRRRHETIAAVRNRLDELTTGIERTLVDVDTLVAQSAAAAIGSLGTAGSVDDHVDRLREHVSTLAEAHRQMSDL